MGGGTLKIHETCAFLLVGSGREKRKKLEEGKETLPMCLMGKMPLHGVTKSIDVQERGWVGVVVGDVCRPSRRRNVRISLQYVTDARDERLYNSHLLLLFWPKCSQWLLNRNRRLSHICCLAGTNSSWIFFFIIWLSARENGRVAWPARSSAQFADRAKSGNAGQSPTLCVWLGPLSIPCTVVCVSISNPKGHGVLLCVKAYNLIRPKVTIAKLVCVCQRRSSSLQTVSHFTLELLHTK
jgi:hypothetical protein